MKATDAFLGEHGVFYAQFNYVDALLEDKPALAQIRTAAALIAAALAPHAHLENKLLFEPIDHDAGPVGPTSVMRAEHDQIERLLDAVAAALDVETAANLLRDAIQQAREHFVKEEQAAFPLAEQLLGAVRLHELGADWGKLRGVSGPLVERAGRGGPNNDLEASSSIPEPATGQ